MSRPRVHGLCSLALLLVAVTGPAIADAQTSLRFFGNGSSAPDRDRVKIEIDDVGSPSPGPPADVGSGDFTIEFWLRGAASDNTGTATCGAGYGWITGNVVIDRDRFNQGRGFGISLSGGRVSFGVINGGMSSWTLCGTRSVLDGSWHHIAVTRSATTGGMAIFVDGNLDAQATGPVGDISYPDDGVPGSFCGGPCTNSDPYLVLGAEKHDAGPGFPSFNGYLDELRISSNIRYVAPFTRPAATFPVDGFTRALYRFDEGVGTVLTDAFQNASPGVLRVGGSPAGPVWSTQTPFPGPTTVISFGSATPSFAENTGTANFILSRTGPGTGPASVDWTTSSGTATAGLDFTAASGRVEWAAGDNTPKSFAVTVADDQEFESNETFSVSLGNPIGAAIGDIGSVTATIRDNDPPPSNGVLQWFSQSPVVSESAGTIQLAVTRTGPSSSAVGVSVQLTGGNATPGTDFILQTTSLQWAAGDSSSKAVSVQILDDSVVEIGETFRLDLVNPTGGATLGSATVLIPTIEDDDSGVGFATANVRISESQTPLSLQVVRSGSSSGTVSVDYQTIARTAVAGADFVARSGTLTWAAGDMSIRSIDLTIVDDSAIEEFETFDVQLGNPAGGVIVGAATNTVAIDDDDSGVRLFAANLLGSEGSGSIAVTVERVGSTSRAFTVDYATVDGSATAGSDYTATSGSLNFISGVPAATIFVPVGDDALAEGDEAFTLVLRNPVGASLAAPAEAQITITDNDVAIEFERAESSVDEAAGVVSLNVRRRGATGLSTTARWRTGDGTATAPADYAAVAAGALNWAPGEVGAQTISVSVTDDAVAEGIEGFSVVLLPSAGVNVGTPGIAVVTVFDDDGQPQIPGPAALLAPNGVTAATAPTFSWRAVLGTQEYLLWVEDVTGRRVLQWYTAVQAGCGTGTGQCSVSPGVALASGQARWWIQTWNSRGYGPWSAVAAFTVQATPAASIPLGPVGGSTASPTLSWQAVPGAQEYLLWIDDESGGIRLREWISAANAGCATGAGSCSFTPAVVLPTGRMRFYVQTWNASGYGDWSRPLDFFVGGAPAAARGIAPSGVISTSTPTYSWTAVPGTVEYLLWVDDPAARPRIRIWVTAEAAGCRTGSGVCSFTPASALANGASQWWVQTWNPVGYGPWSAAMALSR